MLGFAIHTASPQLGLMLQGTDPDGEAISRHQVWDLGREVTSQLHAKMVEFIEPYSWQDLGFVAVAKGPGGFTGTRIGVVAARTLAQQLEIPLFGVSCLAALAVPSLGKSFDRKDIAVSMAAKREAVFGAVYRPTANGDTDLVAVRSDEVVPIAEWATILTGWDRPVVDVPVAAGVGLGNSVTGVMEIAIARYRKGERPDWSSVMPFYGQHPVHR
ncbi:MAG: tRNA (adenosine(37)-N6)-threonylcarbamoyltransferase complex dimerization subunit type 1 TsaB [Cyanobacteria bacterium J06598_1]